MPGSHRKRKSSFMGTEYWCLCRLKPRNTKRRRDQWAFKFPYLFRFHLLRGRTLYWRTPLVFKGGAFLLTCVSISISVWRRKDLKDLFSSFSISHFWETTCQSNYSALPKGPDSIRLQWALCVNLNNKIKLVFLSSHYTQLWVAAATEMNVKWEDGN